MTTYQKSEGCNKCNEELEAVGSEFAVLEACRNFRDHHCHTRPPLVWCSYYRDMGVHIDGVFATELEALRYAVRIPGHHVAPLESGEIGNLP